MMNISRHPLSVVLTILLIVCAAGTVLAQAPTATPPETNLAEVRWGAEARGSGKPFNPLYDVSKAIDGAQSWTLFGSKPDGLVGGAVTVRLALPTQVSAVALTQADRVDQFDRAREVAIAVDGRTVARIELADTPGKRQRFPISVTGRQVSFTVLSQYDAADSDVGGWEELEVLTAEDPAVKFALPAAFKPPETALLQKTTPTGRVIGRPRQAKGHPRTLWTAEELAALRRRADTDREVRTAMDDLLRRAADLVETPPVIPQPVATLTAEATLEHIQAARAVVDLGLAYHLSNDRRYAKAAGTILGQYARRFPDYPVTGTRMDLRARIFDRRITMADWLIRLATGYDLVAATLTSRQRKTVSRQLLREAAVCVAGEASYWESRNDAAAVATAAVLATGYAIEDKELIRWGLEGRNDHGGAVRIVDGFINDDGSWLDAPVARPAASAEALLVMAECAWRNGVDLYRRGGGRLKRMLDAPRTLAYPTLALPALHRGGGSTLLGPELFTHEYAERRYGDPYYRLLARYLAPRLGSRQDGFLPWPCLQPGQSPGTLPDVRGAGLLSHSGFVTIATGRGQRRNQVTMVMGSVSGPPRPDVLAIDLFGLERPLAPSPGATYADEQRLSNWYLTAVAHNTPVIDERRQAPSRATPVLLGATEDVALARAWTADAYPGVAIDRTVVLTRNYAVDLVAVFSKLPRAIDLPYHAHGDLATTLSTEAQRYPVSNQPGYFEMAAVTRGTTSDAWHATWSAADERPPLVMTVPAGDETTVITATGWMGNKDVPLVMQRRTTAQTAFAAVINLDRDPHYVSRVEWIDTGSPSSRALKITTRRGTDTLIVGYAPGTHRAGGVQTDARLALVRTRHHLSEGLWQGGVESIYMAGGTRVDVSGNRLTSRRPALLACERMGADLLLIRNLAGSDTVVGIRGLDLSAAGTEDDPNYVSFAVDLAGLPRERKPKLSSIADPVSERLAIGSGLIIQRPGDTFMADRRRYERDRFRIRLRQVHAARLARLDQAMVNQEEARQSPITPGTAVVVEAESFTAQGGGRVLVTDHKIAARGGKAFLKWDEEGHWIQWPVDIPESGYYHLLMKCCSREQGIRRRLEIDGNAAVPGLADFYLPYTGGWSRNKDDWRMVRVEDFRIGQPVLIYLTKGRHTVRMTNVSQSVNLDYFVFASPDMPINRDAYE
jgi:Alginate lyase